RAIAMMTMSFEQFSAIVSANLEEFAALSWREYEHLGRGVVVVDSNRRQVAYCPADKLSETQWHNDHIEENLGKKCSAYHPEVEFVVIIVGADGWRAACIHTQIPPPVLSRMREFEETTIGYKPVKWSMN